MTSIFDGFTEKTTAANHTSGTVQSSSAPNPFFRAMNQELVTDIGVLGQGKLGSFLRRHNTVNGDTASIIDATLDYFLGNSNSQVVLPDSLASFDYTTNFIPVILKTEFAYETSGTDKATVKKPLYIIFDSTPDSFVFSKSANWAGKPILGRPEPVQVFQESSATTVQLVGHFFVNSSSEHLLKLKVSDYIMSLATPSKTRFMPTPVQVIIGEWKNFRAIVNNVSIEFKGPWKITTSGESTSSISKRAANRDVTITDANGKILLSSEEEAANKADLAVSMSKVPSHAPYMFTATMSLTLVSEDNNVKYAEDVISANVKTEMSLDDLSAVENYTKVLDGSTGGSAVRAVENFDYGLYNMNTGGDQYNFNQGIIEKKTNYSLQVTAGYSYEGGDTDRQKADIGVITNAVSSQLSTLIGKKAAGSNSDLIKKIFN